MKPVEQIKQDFIENKEEPFNESGVEGHTIKDYKKIPDDIVLVIAFPFVQAAMSGVWSFGLQNSGKVTLRYLDGTEESAILSSDEITTAENVFNIIRVVQSKREVK